MYREPSPLLDMHTASKFSATFMRLAINSCFALLNSHRCTGTSLSQWNIKPGILVGRSFFGKSFSSFRIIKRPVLNSVVICINSNTGGDCMRRYSNILHFPNYALMHCRKCRQFSTSSKRYIVGLYLDPIPNRPNCYRVGISREKISTLGQPLEYINFAAESRISKGDFLFGIEANKTLYEFISPWNADVVDINPIFSGDVDERTLQKLLADPESLDNYLMILHVEEI